MQQQRLIDLKKTLQRELKVQNVDDQTYSDSESSRAPHRSLAESRSHSAASIPGAVQAPPRVTQSGLTDATLTGSAGQPLRTTNGSNYPFNADGEYDLSLDVNLEYLKHVVLKFVLSRESEVWL